MYTMTMKTRSNYTASTFKRSNIAQTTAIKAIAQAEKTALKISFPSFELMEIYATVLKDANICPLMYFIKRGDL